MKTTSTIIALCILFSLAGMAQSNTGKTYRLSTKPEKLRITSKPNTNGTKPLLTVQNRSSDIWSEDFDGATNVGDSVITSNGAWGKSGTNGDIWKYSTTQTNGCWSFNTAMPEFTTAGNGFLLFDADSANCQDPDANPPAYTQNPFQGSVISPIIDLSANASVALQLEYQARHCCAAAGLSLTVEISGDGGTTWPTSFDLITPAANADEYETFQVNVSSTMGGMAEARFRLTWSGQSHYYWAVDDISIVVAPENDILLEFAYVSHNNTPEEYGRIPQNQTDQATLIGVSVFNFGTNDQDNIELVADFVGTTPYAITLNTQTLQSDSTIILEETTTPGPLTSGMYTGTFTVSSDMDTVGGDNFSDNVLLREFEISDSIYSLDGIGVYSDLELTSLGTNSFTDAEDGFMMLAYYNVTNKIEVTAIEVLLANGTEAGGSIIFALHDTADVNINDVATPLWQADDLYEITQADVDTGFVLFQLDDSYVLENNAYYVSCEMFSNEGANMIRIVDDLTVPQPGYFSMIYIPAGEEPDAGDEQVYTNGNAIGIRLIVDFEPIFVGISEYDNPIKMTLSPNPTTGSVRLGIDLKSPSDLNIDVIGIDGARVMSFKENKVSGVFNKEFDLSALANGVYLFRVSTAFDIKTEKLIINR